MSRHAPRPAHAAINAEDAAKRQNLEPVTFLASKSIGVEVRNAVGRHFGTIEDLLITDGGALRAVIINISRCLGLDDEQIAAEPGGLTCGRAGIGSRLSSIWARTRSRLPNRSIPPKLSPYAERSEEGQRVAGRPDSLHRWQDVARSAACFPIDTPLPSP